MRRFFPNRLDWDSYWIHGRDVPGFPASHGCVGLYDEQMQFDYYNAYGSVNVTTSAFRGREWGDGALRPAATEHTVPPRQIWQLCQ